MTRDQRAIFLIEMSANGTKTLSFLAPATADQALEEAAAQAAVDFLETLPTEELSLEGYEYDLAEAAGAWVPANSALPELFGEAFELLLTEEWPDEDWNDYVTSHGDAPTASRALYAVLKTEIAARMTAIVEEALVQRVAALSEANVGPRHRPSPLAD